MIVFGSFGAWWMIWPESVIRFNPRKMRGYSLKTIRMTGMVWTIFLILYFYFVL
jgi:hypothetical protein